MKKKITSFSDLEVYNSSYGAMMRVMKVILPTLPNSEKYDLRDQMSRACKAVPRLIAEGYAKRHQKAGFIKYLDDAMAESNEMIVSLCQVKDLYAQKENINECEKLIDLYDKTTRQLYKLSTAWACFKNRKT